MFRDAPIRNVFTDTNSRLFRVMSADTNSEDEINIFNFIYSCNDYYSEQKKTFSIYKPQLHSIFLSPYDRHNISALIINCF